MSYPGYPQTGSGSYPFSSPYHATSQLSYTDYPRNNQPTSYNSNPSPMYPLNPTPSMYPPASTTSPFSGNAYQSGYPPTSNSPYPSPGYPQNSNSGFQSNSSIPPYLTRGSMPSPYPSPGIGFNTPAPTSFNTAPQPPYNPMGTAPSTFNTPMQPYPTSYAPSLFSAPLAQSSYDQRASAPPPSFNSQPAPLPYDPRNPSPYPSNYQSQPAFNPTVSSGGIYPPLQSQPAYSGMDTNSNGSQFRSSFVPTTPAAGTGSANYSSVSGVQGYNVVQPKGTPTLRPQAGFDPRHDAELLRRAMKGFGTDEKAIITVLAHRTNEQRLQISAQYKTLYGKDLNNNLKSELSGCFEQLVLAMMTPLPQFYAQELHKSVQGIGTDEAAIIEILCTHDNHYIRTISAAYQSMYRTSLEKDMSGDTSGSFKRLLVSLCGGNRDESTTINPQACAADAQALHRAGALKLGTDESTFNAVLCSRSYAHLAQVFTEYERLAGHDIERALRSEFSGDIAAGLLAIAKCVRNKAAYFAERLHASMAGMGTKDHTLIRIVVTRCELDMADIKREFQAKYHKTLESFIAGDTSGDYKKCLLALIT